VAARLQAAQQQSAWDRVLANAARIYSAPEHSARTA